MKTCPRCGVAFPEDFVYCDQDGAALSVASTKGPTSKRSASKRPALKRRWIVLAAVVAVCVSLVGAYAQMGNYVLSRVSVSVNEVSAHFDGAGSLVPLTNFYLLLNVNMRNDSVVPFTLRSARFDCRTAESRLAELSWPSQGEPPVRIPSKGSSNVMLRLNPRITDPLSQLEQLDRRVTARCEGTVALSTLGMSMTRSLSFEERM